MPRIIGIDLPKDKHIEISLTYIRGIGRSTANQILKKCEIKPTKRAKDLTEDETSRIAAIIQKECKVEGDLRREVSGNIKRLTDIGSYRGTRHRRGLPVRGQRTKCNARTRKGPRRVTIALKKKETK